MTKLPLEPHQNKLSGRFIREDNAAEPFDADRRQKVRTIPFGAPLGSDVRGESVDAVKIAPALVHGKVLAEVFGLGSGHDIAILK